MPLKPFLPRPPSAQTKNQDMPKNKVRRLYNEHFSNNKFRKDTNLVQLMESLAAFGVMDVSVLDGNLVWMFGIPSCHKSSVAQ